MHPNCAALIAPSFIIVLLTEVQKLLLGSCRRHGTTWCLLTLPVSQSLITKPLLKPKEKEKVKENKSTDHMNRHTRRPQIPVWAQLEPLAPFVNIQSSLNINEWPTVFLHEHSFATGKESAYLRMKLAQRKASQETGNITSPHLSPWNQHPPFISPLTCASNFSFCLSQFEIGFMSLATEIIFTNMLIITKLY